MIKLSEALGKGVLANCLLLYLNNNQIGDDGMKALSTALGEGALASLRVLAVEDSPLGVDHPKLKATCEQRNITLR